MCQKLPYCARQIDPCIRTLVDSINEDPKLLTLSSCCGHKHYEPTIVVLHKPSQITYEHFSGVYLGAGQRAGNRYYIRKYKRKGSHYHIPEVINQLPTIVIAEPASIRIKLDSMEALETAIQMSKQE